MALYWTIGSRRRTVDVVADGEVSMTDAWRPSKLPAGARVCAAMTRDDVLSVIVRIRGLHALATTGALAVVATAEQAERVARLLAAAAVADLPMKVFDDVKQARRWMEAQPPRIP